MDIFLIWSKLRKNHFESRVFGGVMDTDLLGLRKSQILGEVGLVDKIASINKKYQSISIFLNSLFML